MVTNRVPRFFVLGKKMNKIHMGKMNGWFFWQLYGIHNCIVTGKFWGYWCKPSRHTEWYCVLDDEWKQAVKLYWNTGNWEQELHSRAIQCEVVAQKWKQGRISFLNAKVFSSNFLPCPKITSGPFLHLWVPMVATAVHTVQRDQQISQCMSTASGKTKRRTTTKMLWKVAGGDEVFGKT